MSHCGECGLCCKLLKIEELDKPQGKWCGHCKPGKGCTAYETRPGACRSFSCLWLASRENPADGISLADELRPDRYKVMLTLGGWRNENLVLHEDPDFAGAWRTNPQILTLVNAFLAQGREVIVVTGNRRTLLQP